jgi:hypothetical protein
MDGHTATRHTTVGITLQAGDSIRIEGVPNEGNRVKGDEAGLDYVEWAAQ